MAARSASSTQTNPLRQPTTPAPRRPTRATRPRGLPLTLFLGLAIMLSCQALLWLDVHCTGRGPVHTDAEIIALRTGHPPLTFLPRLARLIAVNMTPLSWFGYIIFLDGLLVVLPKRHIVPGQHSPPKSASPLRARPHHFVLLALASVFIWCVFDYINFYFIAAWRYIGMPGNPGIPGDFSDRFLGYFLSFATIVPGMLLTGQAFLNLGLFDWAQTRKHRQRSRRLVGSASADGMIASTEADAPGLPRWAKILVLLIGMAMFLWPFLYPDPITNLTLWTSLVFFLDPLNCKLGRPSMLRDWQNGYFARTLAAFAGGLTCGLLWEYWNYWALCKWVYHLPFLGRLEQYKYFEMPLIGLLGFIPFALECWVMWQTLRIPLDGLAEPLPNEATLL
ncbi:MAG TPA: hypothetical protein VIL86_04450 [Tepidisphaeraceae bacterium]|jgi:hypothetical protein